MLFIHERSPVTAHAVVDPRIGDAAEDSGGAQI